MTSAKDVTILRKSGKLEEATELVQTLLVDDPKDFYLQNAYGWVIYEWIKRTASQHEKGDLQSYGLVSVFDKYLSEYAKLDQLRQPDLLHSLILTQTLKGAKEWHKFLGFAYWWDPDSFRDEDAEPFELSSGKKMPGLVMRYSYAIGRALADENTEAKQGKVHEWAVRYFEASLKKNPNDQWLNYHKSRQLISQNRYEEAREFMLPVVKRQQRASWAWSLLAKTWEEESHENAIVCYQQAITVSTKAVSILKVRVSLARLLAQAERFQEAASHVQSALQTRDQNGYKIPSDLAQMSKTKWYLDAISNCDLPPDPDVSMKSSALLFDKLNNRIGVIDNQNNDKSLAHVAFSSTDGVVLRYKQFRGIKKLPSGTLVEVGFDGESLKRPIRFTRTRDNRIAGFYEDFEGVLEQPVGKEFGFVRVDKHADIFVPPFVMSKLRNTIGQSVNCQAILSQNKKKGTSGWKALSVN